MRTISGVLAVGLLALGAAPIPALAAGKAGLWSITTKIGGMPAMPQLTPEQMAMMQQHGIQMPNMAGGGMVAQKCVSPQEAAANVPPKFSRDSDNCTMQNVQAAAQSVTGDMVCKGQMDGQGHFQVSYDSAEHYQGSMDFNGTASGHPVSTKISFEGKWMGAECGNVK